MKKKILILAPFYLPGNKAGGPIRTLASLVGRLDQFSFKIITRDRDFKDRHPYSNISCDEWLNIGNLKINYATPRKLLLGNLCSLMNNTEWDLLYLNTFFCPFFSLGPLVLWKFGFIPRRPIVIAPRGELAPSALGLKYWKKKYYILFIKWLGLHSDPRILWQASSIFEQKDIKKVLGAKTPVIVAPNLSMTSAVDNSVRNGLHFKKKGDLKVVFVGRLAPVKNLNYALDILRYIKGMVEFNIYGALDDERFWRTCQSIISTMPQNIRVNYRGAVAHEKISKIYSEHHLLLLPTRGENFGHAILESLAAGCPVLISDRTPWKNLNKKKAGWDIPLEDSNGFRDVLQNVMEMDGIHWKEYSEGSVAYAKKRLSDDSSVVNNVQLFEHALSC